MEAGGAGFGEAPIEPTMRVYTVLIAVSDEIPFDLFWPTVCEAISGAVCDLCPSGALASLAEEVHLPSLEQAAVHAAVTNSGMCPIAQRLTRAEAETLASRAGFVVQTAVVIDHAAVEEVQKTSALDAMAAQAGAATDDARPAPTRECIICLHEKATHAATPCGHFAYCETCAAQLAGQPCAVCRAAVTSIIRIY